MRRDLEAVGNFIESVILTTRKEVYELIPPDMLHWCPQEENFVLFSEEEIEKIILDCIMNGIKNDNDIYKVIGQFEQLKLGALILDRYLKNQISFIGIKRKELAFTANNNND